MRLVKRFFFLKKEAKKELRQQLFLGKQLPWEYQIQSAMLRQKGANQLGEDTCQDLISWLLQLVQNPPSKPEIKRRAHF
jgi:hypothetical protein